jgi:hypothetical protein
MSLLDLQVMGAAEDVSPQWSTFSWIGCVSALSASICIHEQRPNG